MNKWKLPIQRELPIKVLFPIKVIHLVYLPTRNSTEVSYIVSHDIVPPHFDGDNKNSMDVSIFTKVIGDVSPSWIDVWIHTLIKQHIVNVSLRPFSSHPGGAC